MNGLTYKDRVTEQSHHLEMAGVFVQIGLLPHTDFVKETQPPIALSKFREIEINPRCKTSVPGIFAAGDCTTVP
jgi:alkyl hydroperoxide reductase subunit F